MTSIASSLCRAQYQQRQLGALWTIPPPRRNLVSPYTNSVDIFGVSTPLISKIQLDMRRKVEILKYANKNSQSNGTSRTQKWSRLNTQISVGSYSQHALQNTPIPLCAADALMPSSTSSCDVPGPPMILQYDPTIPLYNYANNTDSYSMLPPSPAFTFETYTKNEIYFLTNYTNNMALDTSSDITGTITNTMVSEIGVLRIGIGVLQSTYMFTLNIPVGLYIYGFISPAAMSYIKSNNIGDSMDIKIISYTIIVLYNDAPVYTSPAYQNANTLKGLVFNLRDLNKEPSYNFYAVQYIGNLAATMTIPVQPGYNYTVQVSYKYSYTQLPAIVFETGGIQTGVFSNLTDVNANIQVNCSLLSQPPANYVASSFIQFAVPPAFGLADVMHWPYSNI